MDMWLGEGRQLLWLLRGLLALRVGGSVAISWLAKLLFNYKKVFFLNGTPSTCSGWQHVEENLSLLHTDPSSSHICVLHTLNEFWHPKEEKCRKKVLKKCNSIRGCDVARCGCKVNLMRVAPCSFLPQKSGDLGIGVTVTTKKINPSCWRKVAEKWQVDLNSYTRQPYEIHLSLPSFKCGAQKSFHTQNPDFRPFRPLRRHDTISMQPAA